MSWYSICSCNGIIFLRVRTEVCGLNTNLRYTVLYKPEKDVI